MCRVVFFFIVVACLNLPIEAQTSADHAGHAMTSPTSQKTMPDMPGMTHNHQTQSTSFIEILQSHTTSGTDAEPASTPSQMLMLMKGQWRLMLHGEVFLNEVQQSGPRGGDKFFSTNWLMGM